MRCIGELFATIIEIMQPVAIQHIELRPSAIHGQKACIADTRISVQDVYVWHELMGKTPDQIVLEYPFLSLAQVHAALAYFHDHAEEIRAQVKRGREEAERSKPQIRRSCRAS